jgi:hypothetical protein
MPLGKNILMNGLKSFVQSKFMKTLSNGDANILSTKNYYYYLCKNLYM